LEADLQRQVEIHFLGCPACHAEIRFAAAVRDALGGAPAPHRRRWNVMGPALGIALAAGVASVLLLAWDRVPADRAPLGFDFEPPIYLGVPVRATTSPADSLFDAAMAAYDAGRYPEAAAGLRRAAGAGADPVLVGFFLGASLLQMDQAAEAADAFAAVSAGGESEYLAESRFYRSLALLRLGRGEEAAADLRALATGTSELRASAAALLRQIEELSTR